MPTRDGYAEGIPSWIDLATPDLEGAKSFYGELFGWEFEDTGSDMGPYTMVSQKGLVAAGIGIAPEGQPSVWSTYFAVDDADATATKIEDAGGSMMMECSDIPGAGRLAFATDPTGAAFGIWQAGEHFGAAIVNEHGSLNWNELTSDDLESALPFYEKVFGHAIRKTENPTGDYTLLSINDTEIAGAMAPPVPNIPNNWGIYFAVDDTQKAIDTALANGGSKTYGPMDIPDVGIIAGLQDPYGAFFTVIQLASPID